MEKNQIQFLRGKIKPQLMLNQIVSYCLVPYQIASDCCSFIRMCKCVIFK